jgi:hypothetical protein
MSVLEIVIRMAVVALLAGYLYRKHRRRLELRSTEIDPAEWTGQGIDVSNLRPRLESVRTDYLMATRQAPETDLRRGLLEQARRWVRQLSYFKHRDVHQQDAVISG